MKKYLVWAVWIIVGLSIGVAICGYMARSKATASQG